MPRSDWLLRVDEAGDLYLRSTIGGIGSSELTVPWNPNGSSTHRLSDVLALIEHDPTEKKLGPLTPVEQTRELHEEARHTQFKLDRIRARRNEIIRELRVHNPNRWSYTALAKATGMPKELIAAIVQGRTS